MILPRRGSACFRVHSRVPVSMVLAAGLVACVATPARAAGTLPADLAAYRDHLTQLGTLVVACQQQRDASACDPSNVGSDDHVRWPAGSGLDRTINYGWLRELLRDAGKGKAAEKQPAAPAHLGVAPGVIKTPPPSIDKLLTAALGRLAADAKQIDAPASPAPSYTAQQRALAAILARREYKGVTQVTARERFLEWLGNAIDALLARLAGFGSRLPWIGFVVRGVLIAGLCVLLAWLLIRIERRSRIRLVEGGPVVPGAPSAREWQLWLKDAQAMDAQGLWREAIHFLYWAAIARLESRRLWPADRARTPREYLRLLPTADANRPGLTALTRTFERTWYGGREATATEYQSARQLAAGMGVE